MSACMRVQKRIECPECGYPASEAMYLLSRSHIGKAYITSVDGKNTFVIDDPGHTEDKEKEDELARPTGAPSRALGTCEGER